MKLVSPLYTPVIAWLPTPGYVTAQVAEPATSGCAAQPAMTDAPSMNATLPVGVPLAGTTAVTVAV